MTDRELIDLLQFELKFIEDGGYGRSPRTPWRPPLAFEDSPTCINFGDAARPEPCNLCGLARFFPAQEREGVPCRQIALDAQGHTVEWFYQHGTQQQLEEALAGWLKQEIARLRHKVEAGQAQPQAR